MNRLYNSIFAKELIVELAELELENQRLREQTADEAVRMIAEIVEITGELFGADVNVARSCDPEFPDNKSVVFSVQTSGTVRESCEAEREWIRRIEAIAPHWKLLRLAVRLR